MSDLLIVRAQLESDTGGDPVDDDLARINAYTTVPLKADQIYTFPTVMVTGALTDHAYSLGSDSISNFAHDADAGVPYHLQHNRDVPPYGYTYKASYDPDANTANASVYIVKGRYPAGKDQRSSNQEIADIQQGLRREVSVGFGGVNRRYTCDMCGNDLMSEDCKHFPGMRMDGKLSTMTVHGARLVELSGVDRGACPGAIIQKAQQLNAPRLMGLVEFRGWAEQMQVSDWTKTIHIPGDPGKESEMALKATLAAALASKGFGSLSAVVLSVASDDEAAISAALAGAVEAQVNERLAAHPVLSILAASELATPEAVHETCRLAKQGIRLGTRIREYAKGEAIRALGAEACVNMETVLADLPVENVEQMAAAWTATANAKAGITDDKGGERMTRPLGLTTVSVDANLGTSTEVKPKRVEELLKLSPLGDLALKNKGKE